MGVGETGVGETGVGEMGIPRSNHHSRKSILVHTTICLLYDIRSTHGHRLKFTPVVHSGKQTHLAGAIILFNGQARNILNSSYIAPFCYSSSKEL